MTPNATPEERFEGWFVRSIEALGKLPEGDGAFAALMVALPLYERYVVSKLKHEGKPTKEKDVKEAMSADMGLDDGQRSVFWSVFRVGFAHQAMGHDGKTKWAVSHTYEALPTFKTIGGVEYILLDPWKFAQRVIDKFRNEPHLLTVSDSFPLAQVFSM